MKVIAMAFAKETCIIGAGPAGVQLGYFFQKANRDYVIIERNSVPGSFYEKYPIHHELISVNKRHVGTVNQETKMRQDWNSLIDNGEFKKFYDYTIDYFADTKYLLQYIKDFTKFYNLNIVYNTKVIKVRKDTGQCNYTLETNNPATSSFCCRSVIVATGFVNEKSLNMEGSEYITQYGNASPHGIDYANKNVMIIGFGNSAFETSKEIYRHAAHVHMIGRGPVKLSWETHYVGHLRGINNEMLDSYMLKSLDGLLYLNEGGTLSKNSTALERGIENFRIVKGHDSKFYFQLTDGSVMTTRDNGVLRFGYDVIISCAGFAWDPEIFEIKHPSQEMSLTGKKLTKGKYAAIKPNFESTVYDDIFFAGTITHGLDFQKSAGGFIHGYRYTDYFGPKTLPISARTLFRLLEYKNHNIPFPSTSAKLSNLPAHLLKRINEASSLYQMFSFLSDVAILNKITMTYRYVEDVPVRLLPELQKHTGITVAPEETVLVMIYQYGANFSKAAGWDTLGLGTAVTDVHKAHESNFLHPVIYHYDRLPTEADFQNKPQWEHMPKPSNLHHVLEDFNFVWDSAETFLLPLRKFIESIQATDLREFRPENCASILINSNVGSDLDNIPLSCRQLLLSY